MKLKVVILVIVLVHKSSHLLGQKSFFNDRKIYFSEQIYLYHKEYSYKAKRAYKIGKNDIAEYYYNELLNNYLIGSYMDNFLASCLNKKMLH